MKKLLLTVAVTLLSVSAFATDYTDAARKLIGRIVPEKADCFVVEKLPAKGGDRFELSSRDGKIVIAGNNANSIAVGLNHYLKYYCHTDVSWYAADAISIPDALPAIDGKIAVDARCKNRFFLNYCTYGYTMPWWTWKDWERLIDWMALQGVTMPLAITGEETIWYKVWTSLGLTDAQVRAFFTGPAHLPWHRMSNIDYWQGPLPESWLQSQAELQKKIVARERELNMHPVLPAFAGHVPQELLSIYPNAKIAKLAPWAGFPKENACSFLDPLDPLYTKIQKMYIAEQTKMYGTDHIYGVDIFNELVPPSWEPTYLASIGKRVYASLKAADPKATWLQMGWLFYYMRSNWTNERIEAYLKSIPQDHQIILDYWAEYKQIWSYTDSFFGTPFIWCYLGNFGGNTNLNAEPAKVNQLVEDAFAKGGKNFVGLGSTLEGFDLNPFMYEYLFEKAWNFDTHKDIKAWTDALAFQRTGTTDKNAADAWQLLMDSVYQSASYGGASPSPISRPRKFGTFKLGKNVYNSNRSIITALDKLLAVKSNTAAYRFDVVNLTREMLKNTFAIEYAAYEKAYNDKDISTMLAQEQQLKRILTDLDRTLATDPSMLMGKWIADARSFGTTDAEKDYYESNARALLTTWGDKGSALNDYASRMWAGMVGSYYAQRWNMFFADVNRAVMTGNSFDDARFKEFSEEVSSFEKMWWDKRIGKFSETPKGDAVETARRMVARYRAVSEK